MIVFLGDEQLRSVAPKLEPNTPIEPGNENIVALGVSIAISLKRIADSLADMAEYERLKHDV